MKECTKCNEVKSIDSFRIRKDRPCGYMSSCKSCEAIKGKRYREENKEYYTKFNKEWFKNNKEHRREYKRDYYEEKMKEPLFKLKESIRKSIRKVLINKKSRTHEILGCSYEDFKKHIESKFDNWMTWENKGLYNGCFNYGWDIDHIIPLSSARSEEDLIKLNHYSNLQPLCSKVNRDIKKDNLNW